MLITFPPQKKQLEKVTLKAKELPVTIIAAMWESNDTVLIAADSGITDTEKGKTSLPTEKLQCQSNENVPLAWGTAGNYMIGREYFSPWLKAYEWEPENLQIFQTDVWRNLSGWNGMVREIKKSAKLRVQKNDLTEALVVGYLDKPFILHVDVKASLSRYYEGEFCAIGSCAWEASLLYTGVAIVAPFREIPFDERWQRLKSVIEKTTSDEIAPQCKPPIHVWRVSQTGIKRLS